MANIGINEKRNLQEFRQEGGGNANNLVQKASTGTSTYVGMFTTGGVADAYGIPQDIIESLIQPSGLMDRFNWDWDNRPIVPMEIVEQKSGTDDGSFAEGGCPQTGRAWDTGRITSSAKSFGACSERLSMVALASKQHRTPSPRTVHTAVGNVNIASEWQFQMFKVFQRIGRIYEYLGIVGDATVNANNYNGLLRLIRTGYTDVEGVAIPEADSLIHNEACTEVTIRKLEEVLGAMEGRYVEIPEVVMVMRPGMFAHLAYKISLNYMNPGEKRQQLLRGRTLPLYGYDIPVETTMFMPRTGQGTTQSWCEDILFLTFNYLGQNTLKFAFFDFSEIVANYAELFAAPAGAGGLAPSPFVMVNRDRNTDCTAAEFCIFAHGHMIAEAPQSLAKITNVAYSALEERTITHP